MHGIDPEMTVQEALQFCSPAQQVNLKYWAESFRVKLCEFHIGHIKTYEDDRRREVSLQVVNTEVSTLLGLLKSAGVGGGIERYYRSLQGPIELSPEERSALPEKVAKYIEKLEAELRRSAAENDRIGNRLRKANWTKWRT